VRIDNQTLKLFSGSMGTCLAAGLPPQKSLELSAARTSSRALRAVVTVAQKRCDAGLPLSEALAPAARLFPRHFLPVLHAGETSGRQAEAFQLIYQHSLRIGPSLRVVRNTWLYPLVCIGIGWVLRIAIFVYFGKYHAAMRFVATLLGTVLPPALGGWLLFRLPPVKRTVDFVLLQIPLLRETELRLSLVLFFSTFRLAYEGGGLGVVRIFDLALATVRNDAIRRDLLAVRAVLEQHGTVEDAFEQSALLEDEFKGLILTGALSGQLDEGLMRIVEQATWQLDLSLRIFNQIFQRVVVFCVVMSLIETVLICIL
jgi:type II secretory pathway component PulF